MLQFRRPGNIKRPPPVYFTSLQFPEAKLRPVTDGFGKHPANYGIAQYIIIHRLIRPTVGSHAANPSSERLFPRKKIVRFPRTGLVPQKLSSSPSINLVYALMKYRAVPRSITQI
jgi:hypothetical protein